MAKNFEGKEINYTVKEVNQSQDYKPTYETAQDGQLVITNTYEPEKTEISGTKTWDDNNNQDGQRPESITINLLADGNVIDTIQVTEATDWKYSFTNLPKFANGQAIVYTITEDVILGYTPTITGNNVTNSHTPGKTSATVTKAWDDQNNQDGKRPTSIQVQLYAGDEKSGPEVTLNEGNNWTNTWTDLPEKHAGKTIVYTVKEVSLPAGYVSRITSVNQGNMVITNTYEPEKTEISGTKTWDDNNDQDGQRPESITINLLADGNVIDTTQVTEATDWKYSFTNLPKFAKGEKIIYTVTENAVTGYSSVVEGSNVTNTYTPDRTSATVTKAWDDKNDQDALRPTSIKVQLYANDKKSGPEVTLNEATKWTHTWSNLAEKEKRTKIVYTVKEVKVAKGYNVSYKQDNHGNLIITNSHTPTLKGKDIPKNPGKNLLPRTGEAISLSMVVLGMLVVFGVAYIYFNPRKYGEKK